MAFVENKRLHVLGYSDGCHPAHGLIGPIHMSIYYLISHDQKNCITVRSHKQEGRSAGFRHALGSGCIQWTSSALGRAPSVWESSERSSEAAREAAVLGVGRAMRPLEVCTKPPGEEPRPVACGRGSEAAKGDTTASRLPAAADTCRLRSSRSCTYQKSTPRTTRYRL